MEGDYLPIEEEKEPTSEVVDGLELLFGRGKSSYKDVYPHHKGWQAKFTVEDKGVCSLGHLQGETERGNCGGLSKRTRPVPAAQPR